MCSFFVDNGTTIHDKLKEVSGQRTVPNVYIRGKHIGGADDTIKLHEEGKLMKLIVPPSENYTYDLIVVGGGSGGLACSKVESYNIALLRSRKFCLLGYKWNAKAFSTFS